MSASGGWLKVATGLRLVASAAATQSSERAAAAANAAASHGWDISSQLARGGGVATTTASASRRWQQDEYHNVNGGATVNGVPLNNGSVNGAYVNGAIGNDSSNNDRMNGDMIQNEYKWDETTSKDPELTGPSGTLTANETQNEETNVDPSNSEPTETAPTASPPSHASVPPSPPLPPPPTRFQTGTSVPSTRLSRALSFTSLGIRVAAGTVAELSTRLLSPTKATSSSSVDSLVATDANSARLAASLCRMRGAALKLGQMLSIQDESLLPPALAKALAQVRQGADAMPAYQLEEVLRKELGDDWRGRLDYFEDVPMAAASLGQVHRAGYRGVDVAMKVQYPGVADSIESDLGNLSTLVNLTGLAPKGLFIENVIRVGTEELKLECDYLREKDNQNEFRRLVANDDVLSRGGFTVPRAFDELTTSRVLTSEYVTGGTIDEVAQMSQEERNRIARGILRLTMLELFRWRFMQTDPNWGNFLYDVGTRRTHLIDFGAARRYDKGFVDGYLQIVWAAANRDEETLMDISHRMGFLTGDENDVMLEAHKMSGFTVGEPFATNAAYNFKQNDISRRIGEHGQAFLTHRLTPPPEEVYTLHRKIAGAYNLCIKLGAVISCRDILEEVMENYDFDNNSRID